MTEYERDQIAAWLSDPENTKSLSVQDQIKIAMANIEFMEKIEPIVKKAIFREKGATFLFKM
ncbi:hypothetical protein [uncultured Robinsoniella sp.]|uniref:hypothetical protein n=1 Tax=uncultured Robinsoniella sp. TaxID=904190 RepID=UPI002052E409|nr:MAG TPA: hypothetical protein [Caudoviricetes sp.]